MFAEWRQLRHRDRRLIEFFTLGNSPSEAAAELRVSRISQIRDELHTALLAYHGEAVLAGGNEVWFSNSPFQEFQKWVRSSH